MVSVVGVGRVDFVGRGAGRLVAVPGAVRVGRGEAFAVADGEERRLRFDPALAATEARLGDGSVAVADEDSSAGVPVLSGGPLGPAPSARAMAEGGAASPEFRFPEGNCAEAIPA